MITENLSTLKIHKLTQEQYDRELESGNLDENALYLTPEKELEANRVLISDDSGKVAVSDVTNIELSYLDGATSNIQTQLDTNAGIKTSNGGEIFNDYENNKALSEYSHVEGLNACAGARAFGLDESYYSSTDIDFMSDVIGGEYNEGWYHLTSVDGISDIIGEEPIYTIVLTGNYDFRGVIKEVDVVNKKIRVTNFVLPNEKKADGSLINNQKLLAGIGSYILLVDRSDIGDIIIGECAHADGVGTIAAAEASSASGKYTKALGKYSTTRGKDTVAGGYCSRADGMNTKAIGEYSSADGSGTTASGKQSRASGRNSVASGEVSTAEGNATKATGACSHSEGNVTEAKGESSHAEGYHTTAKGDAAHAEGFNTTASGYNSHAQGESAEASGKGSHAEGCETKAIGLYSHAEGRNTEANNEASHAEGYMSKASGIYAHAEGNVTQATGSCSHSEGNSTEAKGESSHAGGQGTHADYKCSFTHGLSLYSGRENQAVFGEYNECRNGAIKDVLLVVGNGKNVNERFNAFTVNKDGTATVQTAPQKGNDVATKDYVDTEVDKLTKKVVVKDLYPTRVTEVVGKIVYDPSTDTSWKVDSSVTNYITYIVNCKCHFFVHENPAGDSIKAIVARVDDTATREYDSDSGYAFIAGAGYDFIPSPSEETYVSIEKSSIPPTVTPIADTTTTLVHNTEYRFFHGGKHEIIFDRTNLTTDSLFESWILYTQGSTNNSTSNPSASPYNILSGLSGKWYGDNVSNGSFAPTEGSTYKLSLSWSGKELTIRSERLY